MARSSAADQANYLQRLRARIDGSKRYPSAARRLRIQGRVTLRVRIDRAGRLVAIKLVGEADALLRDAARAAVERAAPFPPLPVTLDRDALEVVVPVVFALED